MRLFMVIAAEFVVEALRIIGTTIADKLFKWKKKKH